MSPRNRVALWYPQAPDSIFITFYGSQNCGGAILTRLHIGSYRNNTQVSWGFLDYETSRAVKVN
jgi:hypothetical protein